METVDKRKLVEVARKLERTMARRRKMLKGIAEADAEIRDLRKFVRDLTEPEPSDVYAPAGEDGGGKLA